MSQEIKNFLSSILKQLIESMAGNTTMDNNRS